jgi:arylsulfatase A-like enzyme
MAQTLLEMAGLPSPRDMQGKSMVPVLKGDIKGDLHEALYYHFYENGEHNVAKHLGIRTDRHKLVFFYELGEWELYDLETDPSEMRNLYGLPQYRQLADELGSRLLKLTEGYDDREAVALLKAARKKTPASE